MKEELKIIVPMHLISMAAEVHEIYDRLETQKRPWQETIKDLDRLNDLLASMGRNLYHEIQDCPF